LANDKNIIVGAANVWVGSTPNTIVEAPTGTSTTLTGWRPVGYTMEGVEVSYEPDFGEVEVDQLLDSARIFKQGMRVTVNTTFAEAPLENLLVIWGQDGFDGLGGTLVDEVFISAGSLGTSPQERSVLFVGPAPAAANGTARERIYHLARALQTESSSFALRRAEATGLPASFRCLPGYVGSSGGARYGRITDRAATALLTSVA
jgi:hypothetical protein